MKTYLEETGRKLADPFHEHLCEDGKDDKYVSKQVSQHFNLANHPTHNITICYTQSCKILVPNTFYPHKMNEHLSLN